MLQQTCLKLASGDKVMIYISNGQIVLQVRHLIHGDADPTAASFKSGVPVTSGEAIAIARELLHAVTLRDRQGAKEKPRAQAVRA